MENILGMRSKNRSIAQALNGAGAQWQELATYVQWASRIECCVIRKGRSKATIAESSSDKGRKVVAGTFVSAVFVVTSENKELLQALEYDLAAAGEVLLNDDSSDVIAMVPFSRISNLKQEGASLTFSYLAHCTLVHVGKSELATNLLAVLPHNALQKSVGHDVIHHAELRLGSDKAAAVVHDRIVAGCRRFGDAMSWMTMGLPLKTEIIPTAVHGAGAVLDSHPQFGKAFALPQQWDEWIRADATRYQQEEPSADPPRRLDILFHSPLGPAVAHIHASTFNKLIDDQCARSGALFKVVAKALPTLPTGETGSKITLAKVAWQAGGEPSSSEAPRVDNKCVQVHIRATLKDGSCSGGEGEGASTAASGPTRAGGVSHAGKGAGGMAHGGHSELQARGGLVGGAGGAGTGAGPWLGPAAAVVAALLLPWVLSGFAAAEGAVMLKAALLLAAGLAGVYYLQQQQPQPQQGEIPLRARGSSSGQLLASPGSTAPVAARWELELMLAQVSEYMPEEPSEDTPVTRQASAQLVADGRLATLMETKPAVPDNHEMADNYEMAPEFRELMKRSPWVTSDIITRFVKGMGSEAVGYNCLRDTVEWREREGINTILQRPMRIYSPMKRLSPHSLLCPARDGSPIIFLTAGQCAIKFDEILSDGIGIKDLEEYFVQMLEWCTSKYDMRGWPHGVFHVFMDMRGVSMSHFRGQRLRSVTVCLGIFEKHYKERLGAAVVLNAPSWWGFIWRIISPLLPQAILDKIQLTTSEAAGKEAMLKLVDEEHIPREYGGSCPWALGDSPWDREQHTAIEACNRAAGIP